MTESEKFYYLVSEFKIGMKSRRSILVLATNKNNAKHAWRYVFNRQGKYLRVTKKVGPHNQETVNKVLRHSNVLLGDWQQ